MQPIQPRMPPQQQPENGFQNTLSEDLVNLNNVLIGSIYIPQLIQTRLTLVAEIVLHPLRAPELTFVLTTQEPVETQRLETRQVRSHPYNLRSRQRRT